MPQLGSNGRLKSQGKNNVALSFTQNPNLTSDSYKPLSPKSEPPVLSRKQEKRQAIPDSYENNQNRQQPLRQ